MKYTNLKFFILFYIMILTFVCGCSKSDSTSGTAVATTELEGTWFGACVSSSQSHKEVDVFSGTSITRIFTYYSDANCSIPLYVISGTGTITIGEVLTTPTNSKKINWSTLSMTVTPKSTAMVTSMNTNSYCGMTNWVLDIASDTLGKSCSGTTISSGDITYTIFKISDLTLYWGDVTGSNNGTTEALRPTTLLTTIYTKQ